jgi:tRNA pseudouridine65 synthase
MFSELEIVYRDEFLIAINKPSGLLVHRSFLDKRETLFAMQMLRDQIGQHVFPLHRLDRPTSGVLLFALSSEVAKACSTLFAEHQINKRYLALTRGFAPSIVELDYPLKYKYDKIADKFADQDKPAQEAQTSFNCLHQAVVEKPLGKYPSVRYSLVKCLPKTGRKHQIRRHLNHLNHPIINDANYGDNKQNHFFQDEFKLHRLMLFAKSVSFIHPITQEAIHIEAPLGEEALALFKQLGWPSEESNYTEC